MSVSTIVPLIFVGFGLVVAALGVRSVLSARSSAHWPSVPGQIAQAKIVPTNKQSFAPAVRYSYSVNGQTYHSDRICFGIARVFGPLPFAKFYVDQFRAGTTATVYYDPAAPSNSVLKPGLTKHAFLPMAFGICATMFGGWFLLMLWLFQP